MGITGLQGTQIRHSQLLLPRTGAFANVRTRWLALWVVIGVLLLAGVDIFAAEILDARLSEDLMGILTYGVILAWVALMVVRRGGVDLGAMLRWPRLGAYWFIVAGLLVVQFIFSLGAILITEIVAPWMDDSLQGVGEGNLLLALVGLVVLPPLVEEVVFRGVLLERFTVKWRVGVAVPLSAVLFGILHADPVGAGMFGLITGLLYLRTGSLWPGIVIHAANNLVAVTAVRLGDPDAEVLPAPEVPEILMVAAVLLAVSVPFLAWFIRVNWPSRITPTPYQHHETVSGLPSRTVTGVWWSGAPEPLTLQVTSSDATLSDAGGAAVAVLPLQRVQSVYPSPLPGGMQVVVLLKDGAWSALHIPPGARRPAEMLARTLGERAALTAGVRGRPPATGLLGGDRTPRM